MIVTNPGASLRLQSEQWRIKWVLGIATAVARAADCTRRQVGAVLVDPQTWQVLGSGYNGLPAGAPGCLTAGACPRGRLAYSEVPALSSYEAGNPGECRAHHAEANALSAALVARHQLRGSLLAITDPPCEGCRVLAWGQGVTSVVWPGGSIPPEPGLAAPRLVRGP